MGGGNGGINRNGCKQDLRPSCKNSYCGSIQSYHRNHTSALLHVEPFPFRGGDLLNPGACDISTHNPLPYGSDAESFSCPLGLKQEQL